MTLASFLSLCIALSASSLTSARPLGSPAQSSQSQNTSDQPTQKQPSQKSGEAGQSASTPATATQPSPGPQTQSAPPAATKKGRRKRTPLKKSETGSARVDCPPANSNSGTASADPASGSTSPSGSSSNQTAGPPNQASNQTQANQGQPSPIPSKNSAPKTVPSGSASAGDCPPAKTVIKDGGTSEPSIQLLGSKGADVASQQRTSTDQLLESTEDDLKKAAGRQLSSSQQEMVNQIREFIQQSRAAEAAGDTERARNLARKARLLSDELEKP